MKKIEKEIIEKLHQISKQKDSKEALIKFRIEHPEYGDWAEIIDPEREPVSTQDIPQIDDFKIIKKLGVGASSQVFLATSSKDSTKQAIKVANQFLSEDQLHRIEHEVRLLNSLKHPNIAKLSGSGVTTESGRPYIAMEYVDGESLKAYSESHKLNVKQKIKLFLQVLKAVQYAHNKGVIHRDIKPENILVSEDGVVKLLDFGIAMVDSNSTQQLTQLTKTGEIVGTLSYMSPEQVSGSEDIDTRTDIYSLGVVLYELLSHKLPHKLDSAQIFTAISKIIEERPQRITQVNPKIDESLSAIVHHAIEKDPANRYQTPIELEKDLNNWLNSKPVSVKNHNFWSELKYLASRNKALFTGASLAILGLITGLVLAVNFAYKEQSARQLAEANALSNQKTVDFIQELFSSADPENLFGNDLTLKQVLDNAEFAFTNQLEGEELAEAKIRNTLASVYISLGEHKNSQGHLDRAESLINKLGDTNEVHALKFDQELIQSSINIFNNEYEKDTENLKTLLANDSYTVENELKLRIQLAHGEMMMGQLDSALVTIENGLKISEKFQESNHDLLYAQLIKSMLLEKLGQFEKAKAMNAHIINVRKEHYGEIHPRTLSALNNQSSVENNLGNFEVAQNLMAKVIEGKVQVLGPNHLSTLISKTNLLSFYVKRMNFEKADPYSLELLKEMNENLGSLNKYTLVVNNIRAYLLEDMGKLQEAESLYKSTLKSYEDMGKNSGTELMVLQSNLAMLLMKQENLEESQLVFKTLLKNAEDNLSKDHVYYAIFVGNYGELLLKRGFYVESKQKFTESLIQIEKTFGAEHERTIKAKERLELVKSKLD